MFCRRFLCDLELYLLKSTDGDCSLSLIQFPNLIMKIAGDSNAGFLDVNSGLGSGFYILTAYSYLVITGFLQFSLQVRNDKSGQSLSQGIKVGEKENEDKDV